MRHSIHAAGFAAVSLALAAIATLAAPSQAGEMTTKPITSSYIDHAAATNDGDVATNDLNAPTAATMSADAPAPIAQHALATMSAETLLGGAEDPAPVRSLSQLVSDNASAETADREQECLATGIYFESKSESLEGQLAVAQVIINRAQSGRFPSTLCGVIKQRGQFSFVRGGSLPSVHHGLPAWQRAVAIAHIATNSLAESRAPRAMFFHAARVAPSWHGLTRVATIGNHIFYR
jgi:N-acetylmuramoyl-L-alanine amidase